MWHIMQIVELMAFGDAQYCYKCMPSTMTFEKHVDKVFQDMLKLANQEYEDNDILADPGVVWDVAVEWTKDEICNQITNIYEDKCDD